MRFGITSALSAAGVVAAGVAAFTLNSAVLSSPGAGVSDDAARAAALGAVASTVPGDVTAPAGNVSVASPGSPVTANSTAISGTVTSYQVGTSGTVVIDSGNGTIRVTDVVPAAGWTSEPARTAPDGTVKVHFVRGSERVELFASLSGGKVTVSVVNETPVNPSQSATPSPGQGGTPSAGNGTRPTVPWAGSDDDDDHDEDHEDEDEDHGDDHDDHEDEDDD
ncbi:MAG: hypothetical protein EBT79_08150 [Actinobacteria bacterium]|nr:hypothetical protein [Actinomycetota bacterium]